MTRNSAIASKELERDGQTRKYPILKSNLPNPSLPVSFICVHYSDEFYHNIAKSECIYKEHNEFIVVNNRSNVFFETLGQAINSGIARATNDLIVIVHEDILLPPNWQSMFEESLAALERHDSTWLIAGIVGWKDEQLIGHSSDPHDYRNTLGEEHYAPAERIDEQILILRRSSGFVPDPDLPGIHNIGRDLPLQARRRGGGRPYVINAPAIHKYADAEGELIVSRSDSEKIRSRSSLTYLHSKECSDEYVAHKWDPPAGLARPEFIELDAERERRLNSPVILLGRGGSGTRLMSSMASDTQLFIGNENNPAGDCLEMVGAIYRAVYRKYQCPADWQKALIISDLRNSAAEMLAKAEWPLPWAFKLPESLLILPELSVAFPNARYAFLKRDPLTTVLRRTHMTARLDNEIGRSVLPLAYDAEGLPRARIFDDGDIVRMARSTAHQLTLLHDFAARVHPNQWHEVSFEQLISKSRAQLDAFADFCELEVSSEETLRVSDPGRAHRSSGEFPEETVRIVRDILHPVRKRMGYI